MKRLANEKDDERDGAESDVGTHTANSSGSKPPKILGVIGLVTFVAVSALYGWFVALLCSAFALVFMAAAIGVADGLRTGLAAYIYNRFTR